MAQERAAEEEKPPGGPFLNLIEKQNIVSLEKFPQKEAFLVGKNIFNSHINKVKVQVVTDINLCKDLFNKFSPQDTVFATWDFRYSWYLGYKHTPCFFVVYFNNKVVGLLPLWYENDKNQFRWFGSWWMEENSFWVFDKKYIPLLLAICPPRTYLNAIYFDPPNLNQVLKLDLDDPKYVLNLTQFNNLDDFLAKLKKKQRYNLKRDKRIIETWGLKIIINRFADIERLFQLSMVRFQQKGDKSDFINPKRREIFRQIIKQVKTYQPRMITTEINNQIASVDLVLLYKNTYFALKCAYNVVSFPGIGNFINLYQIQEAISMGFKKIDFLEVSYGWKERLFTSIPLYCFKKDLKKEEVE